MNEENNVNVTEEVSISGEHKFMLYVKIALIVIFLYGFGRHLWDTYIFQWWTGSCPGWLKTGITWFIWLDVSYVIYKIILKNEINERRLLMEKK